MRNSTSTVLLCDSMADQVFPPTVVSLRAKDVFATSSNLEECSVHYNSKGGSSTPHSEFSHVSVCCPLMYSRNKPFACLIEFCRADIMEALPSKADPAVAGGPVSLPSQAAVLHGVRSGSLSQ